MSATSSGRWGGDDDDDLPGEHPEPATLADLAAGPAAVHDTDEAAQRLGVDPPLLDHLDRVGFHPSYVVHLDGHRHAFYDADDLASLAALLGTTQEDPDGPTRTPPRRPPTGR